MKNPYPGCFVVIEGIDGCGKSTLANGLYLALKKRGIDCLLTFEPTKGKWGSILRQSFTAPSRLSPDQELSLFMKDRREHLDKVVIPALRDGRTVICDRYFYSTAAYQGARGLDPEKILRDSRRDFIEPDLCILLELDPSKAVDRIRFGRQERENNFEQLEYLEKVAAIYGQIRDGCVGLSATEPADRIVGQALDLVERKMQEKKRTGSLLT